MNFENFLREKLTVRQYDELGMLLKAPDGDTPKSPHRITKIKNRPEIMDVHELLTLSGLIHKSPNWLIKNFNAGMEGIHADQLNLIQRVEHLVVAFFDKEVA